MLSKATWVVLLAGLGLGLWVAKSQYEAPLAPLPEAAPAVRARPAAAAPATATATPAPPANGPAQPAPAAPAPWPLDSLNNFKASLSYRSFVFEASRNPGPSWYQYAHAAMAYCARSDTETAAVAADPARRQALAALRQRCDMSPAERAAAQNQLFSRRGTQAEGDPVMQASFSWLVPASAAEEREALATLLKTGDPLVLEMLAEPSRGRQDGKNGLGTWFMGSYRDSGKGSDFELAFRLALCELGADCGTQAPETLLLCIERGWCADSYGAAVRAGRAQQFDPIAALAAQISAQLRARNVSAFAEHQ